ncbi:MAG: hypothetical protein KDC94_06380 [Aequorivita sp.]|nr:hypothetical protein [Aequorivita sp.]MCB0455872.1 hypothetical protein [Aequorivita sp.]
MKIKLPTLWSAFATAIFLANSVSYAQVGINTTAPNGILDVNSTSYGVVLPRLALTATNVMAPATNPQTGTIPNGTTVYNTNRTSTGINDVSPGIYVWITDKWVSQFDRKQSRLYESSIGLFSSAEASYVNIMGLTSQTFQARYTGNYRVELKVNFAGGNAKVPNQGSGGSKSDGYLNIAKASGKFRLKFNGTDYFIPAHAYSTAYDSDVRATNYFAIWQEYSTTLYLPLSANQTVSFTLAFDQDAAPEYENDGNSGTGLGNIAYDIPCTVEITYVGE